MFGYVKPYVPELKVKENEFYRATYCGLCRALGRKSRFLSFTLSYDFVFLAIVDMAVTPELKVELGKERCMAHPLHKRAYLKENGSLDRSSTAAALLLYYNLLDDIEDSRGAKRLFAKMCLPKARGLRKKYMGDGSLDKALSEKLAALSEVEKGSASSVYEPAEIFGELLGEVFAAGHEDGQSVSKCLYSLGRYVGRWIYVIDALDDIESDRKSGSYNPFLVSGDADDPDFKRRIEEALTFELIGAERAVDLIDIADIGLKDIIYNIIHTGMPETAKKVISGENKNKKKGARDSEGSL